MEKNKTKKSIKDVELFLKENYDFFKLQYYSGNYKNRHSKITFVDEDGYLYLSSFSSLQQRLKNKLSSNPLKSHYKNFNADLMLGKLYNIKIKNGIFNGYDNKHIFICECGNEFELRFRNLMLYKNRIGCDECSFYKTDYEDISSMLKESKYSLLDKNFKHNKKIQLLDFLDIIDDDGFKYNVSVDNIKYSFKKGRLSFEKFYRKNPHLKENLINHAVLIGEKYDSLEVFDNYTCKTICKNGHIVIKDISNFVRYPTCSKCSKSLGEMKIDLLLSDMQIKYKHQKYIKINEKILWFDFYIKDLKIAIEYNGEQHYEPIEFFGGETQFKKQQLRDELKRMYCERNCIKLIEIPYWDFDNIESILYKELVVRLKDE